MQTDHLGRDLTAAVRPRGEAVVLVAVALATMLIPLNSTMIAVALPRLIHAFGTNLGAAGWLVTGYLIAMASLQPVGGALGDRLGRRPVLLAGLLWFAAASLAAALAPDLELLVAFRIQQAVAGALVFPNGIALLRELAPPGKLAGRLGLVGSAITLAAAAGPLLGGLLLALDGWRSIFLVNLPLVLVPLALGWVFIPRSSPRVRHGRFDVEGAVLLSGALVTASLALGRGLDGFGLASLGAAAVLFPAFLFHELRQARPVIDPRLFRHVHFLAANGGVACSNLAMYVTIFALPLLLARRGGWGSSEVGLVLATLPLATFLISPFGGRIADRAGSRLPAVWGLALLTASLGVLAAIPGSISPPALVAALVGAGLGLGLASAPLQVAAIQSVDLSEAGAASGIFSTSRYLGSILGTVLLSGPLAPASHGLGGFRLLFVTLVVAAGASAVFSLGLPGRARERIPADA